MVSAPHQPLSRPPLSSIKQQEKKVSNFPNTHFQPLAGGWWQTTLHGWQYGVGRAGVLFGWFACHIWGSWVGWLDDAILCCCAACAVCNTPPYVGLWADFGLFSLFLWGHGRVNSH